MTSQTVFSLSFPQPGRPSSSRSLRRVSHGSTAFASDPRTMQPQDGGLDSQSDLAPRRLVPIAPNRNEKGTRAQIGAEPEDARMTGVTRSLFRRVMGLNVRTEDPLDHPQAASLPVRRALSAPAALAYLKSRVA
jgi:hypothetical protein